MPIFKFRCLKCDHEDRVERPLPPKHCPECGSPVQDVRELQPIHVEKTPPEEPDEGTLEDLEAVGRDHAAGKACKYGCIPPTVSKCERCAENKCAERLSDYRRHWKRRKAVRIIRSMLGKDIVDVISDKTIWQDVAESRAKKLLDALGFEGQERQEMLTDLKNAIDKGHEKLKNKLK